MRSSLAAKFKIGRINKERKSASLSSIPSDNLGTSQPSSSTIISNLTTGSWNSSNSYGSFGRTNHDHHGDYGVPVNEYMSTVYENPNSFQTAVELPNRGTPQPRTNPPPYLDASYAAPVLNSTLSAREQVSNEVDRDRAELRRAIEENEAAIARKRAADTEKQEISRQQDTSKEGIRRLRELIRERYALDLDLWEKRRESKADREFIMLSCIKADKILQEIYWIVNAWDNELFSAEEQEMVDKIRECLRPDKPLDNGLSNAPAYWESLPPWERKEARRKKPPRFSS